MLLTHVLLSSFSHSDDGLVLAGLANGKIALYPVSEILQVRDSTASCLSDIAGKTKRMHCILTQRYYR